MTTQQQSLNETVNPQQSGSEFAIQRLYLKDVSYEAPNTPKTFREDWQPAVTLDISTHANELEPGLHEVVLAITATSKNGEQTAFLAEVKQAGIFTMRGFTHEQMHHLLGSYCPNILFPYIREAISDLVNRGGFPPLYLAPINFDALYQQHLQQQTQTKESDSATGTTEV
jgi:preprotein translocase subunit SecB